MSHVGFVLLTHSRPDQIERLVTRLDRSFDRPLIVCHHDHDRQALPVSEALRNVVFVRPHVATRWGTFSVVDALLAALRAFHAHPSAPEWMVFLSGSDYPIKPAGRIVDELVGGAYDAYVGHDLIDPRRFGIAWHELCWRRYCGLRIRVPTRAASGRLTTRPVTLYSRHTLLLDMPYSRRFPCHAGEFWFSANRKAVEHLLVRGFRQRALEARLRSRPNPDETYASTLLANARDLRLNADCKRYVDWSANTGRHPKTLTIDDLPSMLASPAHFARKFDPDTGVTVLDELDALHR
jgi:hypothetical protein